MKGVVLAELAQFAEARLAAAPSRPPYDPVGNYDGAEFLALADAIAARAGTDRPELLKRFGIHLFARFAALYPVFFVDAGSALDLLGGIETYVHGEVQKLYPDAEFPHFEVTRTRPHHLELVYRSARPLADLAEGLVRGCIAHFQEPISVRREDLDADGCHARFVLEASGSPSRRRRA